MRNYLFAASLGLLFLASACDDDEPETNPDAAVIVDAGRDAGQPPPDGGQPLPDSGVLSNLSRPGLERPPTGGLPAELRPPR